MNASSAPPASAGETMRAALLWTLRAIGVFRLCRYLSRSGLTILCWHGVSIEDEHRRWSKLFVTPDTLRGRLEFLRANFEIVSLDEAMRQHEQGRFRPGQVVLTFDEGFANFALAGAPVLREFDAPAAVYVVTENVEERRPFEVLLATDIVRRSRMTSAPSPIPGETDERRDLDDPGNRERYENDVIKWIGRLEPAERMAYARDLAALHDVDLDSTVSRRIWDALTPEEIRELESQGFSFELHTHAHLNVVDNDAEIEDQVRVNQDVLERITSRRPVHFCYPSGRWNREAWDKLRARGVRSATTSRAGLNYPRTPILALKRRLTGEESQLEFEFAMSNVTWLVRCLLKPGMRYETEPR